MCMICVDYQANRMTFSEMEAAVKEAVGSKMMDEPHDNDEVAGKLIAAELAT